jgi:ATP-binding cassette subfamily C (CFTR/MRP) protein 2
MNSGRITQVESTVISSLQELILWNLWGAHKKALSTLDSAEAGSVSESTNGIVLKQEKKDFQNGVADDIVGSKGQIIQEEREKGKVSFSVYWKYITMAYGGALVPFYVAGTGSLSDPSDWKQLLDGLGKSCLTGHETCSW